MYDLLEIIYFLYDGLLVTTHDWVTRRVLASRNKYAMFGANRCVSFRAVSLLRLKINSVKDRSYVTFATTLVKKHLGVIFIFINNSEQARLKPTECLLLF